MSSQEKKSGIPVGILHKHDKNEEENFKNFWRIT